MHDQPHGIAERSTIIEPLGVHVPREVSEAWGTCVLCVISQTLAQARGQHQSDQVGLPEDSQFADA